MSKTRVKTTYSVEGPYGSTETKTLYCCHNHSSDYTNFYYDEHERNPAIMCFGEWETGNDLWDAMNRLWMPYKGEWGASELKDGVEFYRKPADSGAAPEPATTSTVTVNQHNPYHIWEPIGPDMAHFFIDSGSVQDRLRNLRDGGDPLVRIKLSDLRNPPCDRYLAHIAGKYGDGEFDPVDVFENVPGGVHVGDVHWLIINCEKACYKECLDRYLRAVNGLGPHHGEDWQSYGLTHSPIPISEEEFNRRHDLLFDPAEPEGKPEAEPGNEFTRIEDGLPAKGRDVLAVDADGTEHDAFRCSCNNPDCREWRCSVTGSGLAISPAKWRYKHV